MIIDLMLPYLETLKIDGISVEFYHQWRDSDLKQALTKQQYKGSGACAALSYRWIKRQLSKGVLATSAKPVFAQLTPTKLTKIAKDQVTHAQHTQLGFEIQDKGYKPTGYQAIIQAKHALICGLIGDGRFQVFSDELSSDENMTELGWWLEGTVAAAYAVEKRVRQKYLPKLPDFDDLANQFPDFFGILVLRGAKYGHAVALRHDAWTGVVHFFDPNFGHFKFPSWQVFRGKLKPFWRYGYMDPGNPPVFPESCRFTTYHLVQYRKKPLRYPEALAKQWFSISGPEGATDQQIDLLVSISAPIW